MSSRQQPPAKRTDVGTGTGSTRALAAFDTTESCSECGGSSFQRGDAGEWFCRDCGIVHSKPGVELTEPGWRSLPERRTGPAASIDRVSVGTSVGHTTGRQPSWAKYNGRLDHNQRTLRHGLKEVCALATALEVSQTVTEQAAYLFRRAASEDLLRGQSLEAVAAGCLHAAARDAGTPFPLAQVADRSMVEKSAVTSAFHKVVRELELPIAPPQPAEFVPRIASEVEMSIATRERARDILAQLVEDGTHVGQSPAGVAAAALYGASREQGDTVTQSELADAAYASVVTLSRQWQTVKEYVSPDEQDE